MLLSWPVVSCHPPLPLLSPSSLPVSSSLLPPHSHAIISAFAIAIHCRRRCRVLQSWRCGAVHVTTINARTYSYGTCTYDSVRNVRDSSTMHAWTMSRRSRYSCWNSCNERPFGPFCWRTRTNQISVSWLASCVPYRAYVFCFLSPSFSHSFPLLFCFFFSNI